MVKNFISFEDMGYQNSEKFFDSQGNIHLDNGFIGVWGNKDEGWILAYCDSVTSEIIPQDIFNEDNELIDIELLEFKK